MPRCPALMHILFLLMISTYSFAQGQIGAPMPSGIGDSPMPVTHSAEEEGRLSFKSETVLVQVPVIVADKSGAHIHGLVRDDFKVFENGKEQKIITFQEIQTSRSALTAPATQSGEFSNLATSVGGDTPRAITVIALDLINTPFTDQAYGRKQILKYLAESVQPGQTLALVTLSSSGMRVIQGLTSDPAALVGALNKVKGQLEVMHGTDVDTRAAVANGSPISDPSLPIPAPAPGGDVLPQLEDFISHGDATIAAMQQQYAIEATLKGFLTIAWSLSGIPGKKSLIWATGGFPFFLESPSSVPGGNLSVLYERTMQAMNEAEISIYPVDFRGLVSYAPGDVSRSTSNGGIAFGSASGILQGKSLSARSWLQNSTLDTLKDFAEMTGGRAFYNSNDLASSFQHVADDSSSYYLIGYYLDAKNNKAGWRQLKVKLEKPGTQVRARNGFFVTKATVDPEASRKLDVQFAFASPFDSTGIPMTVRWEEAVPDGDKKKIGFNVHLPSTGLLFDQANNNHFSMDFSAIAFKKDVNAANIGRTMQGNLPAASMEKLKASGVNFKSDLELAPGDYTVRVVIRDNLTGRIGSVSAPLTVN